MEFIVPLLVVIGIISSIVKSAKKVEVQRKNVSETSPDPTELTEQQRRYVESLRSRKSHTTPTPTVKKPPVDPSHGHIGKVEEYDEIIGSLGDINDEGCPSLDGVRLIAEDVAYVTEDGTRQFDAKRLQRAIVLGEVLNSPRFKNPYGKK